MKRELDLVRVILEAVEAASIGAEVEEKDIPALKKYSPRIVMAHLNLMFDDGLIENGYFREVENGSDHAYEFTITRMRWAGYEALERIRGR